MKYLAAFFCLWTFCACGDNRPLEEIISLPNTDSQEPRVAAVLKSARAGVEAERSNVNAWRHLGAVLDAHRFTSAAESAYREALSLNADDPWTCYQLAITLEMMSKEPEETLKLLAIAGAGYPKLPFPLIHTGRVLDAQGDSLGARDAYLSAVKIDGRQALLRRALGQVYLDLGANEEAIEQLERAVGLASKTDGPTWAALAQGYERTGAAEKAQRARELAANNGNTLISADPLRRAVSTLGVSSKIALERGMGRMSAGDFQGAVADLEIAGELRPRDPWLQLRLATCFQELRNPAHAAEHLKLAESARSELFGPSSKDDLVEFDAALKRYQNKFLARGN